MTESGDALEQSGARLFRRMGLDCSHGLKDAQLTALNPSGSYRTGEHLEVDYLLPHNDVCLVGEITSRTPKHCPEKLKTFRNHLNAIDHALQAAHSHSARAELWKTLGVESDLIPEFRNVRSLLGFAILTQVEECEIPPQHDLKNCVVLYKYHWDLLNEYVETIGRWARHPFYGMFGISVPSERVSRPLRMDAKGGNLLVACDRFVTADREHTSHVITFLANPYDLLPYAAVCRRDNLPSLDTKDEQKYQRTLFAHKLTDIRRRLLNTPRFTFPNSILAVLGGNCRFDSSSQFLEIPDRYGALNIIDGQHRLFSYADEEVHQLVGGDAQIVVTAIIFDSVDELYIDRFSARTFIEINTNQTRVSSLHLFGIGYEILGYTHHKYLAAHVLRKVNARSNRLRGLLRTSDSPHGTIHSMEIIGSLDVITNFTKMGALDSAKGPSASRRRDGFRELFGVPVSELKDPTVLTERGIACMERYFNLVAGVFKHDWPNTGTTDHASSFGLTKFFAALVRLLRQFIDEGASWSAVEGELEAIRRHVMALRRKRSYRSVLFAISDSKIPDATARISDMFRFLNANRTEATSITAVRRATQWPKTFD